MPGLVLTRFQSHPECQIFNGSNSSLPLMRGLHPTLIFHFNCDVLHVKYVPIYPNHAIREHTDTQQPTDIRSSESEDFITQSDFYQLVALVLLLPDIVF